MLRALLFAMRIFYIFSPLIAIVAGLVCGLYLSTIQILLCTILALLFYRLADQRPKLRFIKVAFTPVEKMIRTCMLLYLCAMWVLFTQTRFDEISGTIEMAFERAARILASNGIAMKL